ncbi:MAG TPA: cupin domain-containing protein [Actinophytocola sp.]|uniref:cupin domain-containing protein n=1 Tax=Actinophytocola sp. TaxID=1872138 RepID=UPI002DB90DDC|nr:cupin domain-containing protein [Actinophytocola sp.]HEU5470234.1 cupin domain-containing protein [Actinophytocola sp.]
MTRPTRIAYQEPEPYESGMVIEEVAADATPGAPHWPFRASRFEVPPGATTELDIHDVAELWLVRSGHGTVRSGGTTLEVGPGEMVYFAGRVPHQVTNTGADAMRLFSVWWNGAPA